MRRRLSAVVDRARCPWTRVGWLLLVAFVVGTAAAASLVALVVGSLVLLVAAIAAITLAGLVAGTTFSEDRATGVGVQHRGARRLTKAWRAATRAVQRLRREAGRLQAGPLRTTVRAQADALDAHLRALQPSLVRWWGDARELERAQRRAGVVSATHQAALADSAEQIAGHLDRVVAGCERLGEQLRARQQAERLGALERVVPAQAALPPADDRADLLAAALAELAHLETAGVAAGGQQAAADS